MKLQLGERVHATNGVFIEIGHVVAHFVRRSALVRRSATRWVLEPHRDRYLAPSVLIELSTILVAPARALVAPPPQRARPST